MSLHSEPASVPPLDDDQLQSIDDQMAELGGARTAAADFESDGQSWYEDAAESALPTDAATLAECEHCGAAVPLGARLCDACASLD